MASWAGSCPRATVTLRAVILADVVDSGVDVDVKEFFDG
jgi:hypothetical protein